MVDPEVYDQFDQLGRPAHYRPGPGPFPWHIPIGASLASLALIAGGSMFKIAQLSSGGTGVAERMGGRRVYPNTTDPVERRLLNVVEEMALASGMPVPPVYMLDRGARHQRLRRRLLAQRRRGRRYARYRSTAHARRAARRHRHTSSATSSTATCGSISA